MLASKHYISFTIIFSRKNKNKQVFATPNIYYDANLYSVLMMCNVVAIVVIG